MGSSRLNEVFDEIRKKHVPATSEELVRQSLIYIMVHRLGFPKELITIERQLSELPHLVGHPAIPQRRADIICFAKNIHAVYPLYPLLLIECKEGKVGEGAAAQALGYNHYVKAPYVAVAGSDGVQLVYPQNVPFLPSYQQLIEKLCMTK